ncbi:S1 family peptidase [Corynebacterium sp. LK2510]|uniref:S1 family peptidase n=1 Tax=Corynebacterium sp. LK2510 TaxID=3110472 RepID=UPI0034CDD841
MTIVRRRGRVGVLASAGALAAVVVSAFAPNASAEEIDPNYVWHSDPVSTFLAGKPFGTEVLHRVPGSFHDAPRRPESDGHTSVYGPGTPVYVGDNMCTVAAAGHDAEGRKVALTAGHCGGPGANVTSADTPEVGASGTVVTADPALDYAVIELGSNAEVSRSYNGVTVNDIGGAPRRPGEVVCKDGVASGHTCGVTLHDWGTENIAHVCAMPGDSGAPLVVGDRMVGIVAGGIVPAAQNLPCYSPLQGPIHGPTRSARMDSVLNSLNASDAPGRGFTLPER